MRVLEGKLIIRYTIEHPPARDSGVCCYSAMLNPDAAADGAAYCCCASPRMPDVHSFSQQQLIRLGAAHWKSAGSPV